MATFGPNKPGPSDGEPFPSIPPALQEHIAAQRIELYELAAVLCAANVSLEGPGAPT